ncbi:aquaporin-like protein [Hypoxylon cercidicola]|nr:aquaporin-like protein [Hypoxylon cercidicola]
MAERKETAPDTDGTLRDGYLTAEDRTELPDTISDLTPDVSRHRSNRRSTIESRDSGQSRRSRNPDSEPMDTQKVREKLQKAQYAPSSRERIEAQGWVDAHYREANPWYGQTNKKPVFSLGKALPRITRWSKVRPGDAVPITKPRAKSPEDLAELGEVVSNTEFPDAEKEVGIVQSDGSNARRTAAGVTHGDRYNDAGQPVFEYHPEDGSTRRERTSNTTNTRKSNGSNPNFGIDSEPLGQREHDEVEEGDRDPNEFRNWWARIRAKHPEPLAEFLATGIAVFMGLGATLSVNLSENQETKYGSYETSCWAWGFAWMFGIYLGGGVSGAHMNPAISISLSIFRGFPWKSCAVYVVVQFLASIVAGALAYGIYRDTILHFDPNMTDTAKTFFSSPQEWVSLGTAFIDQVVGSAIMMIAVFALGDDQNNPPGAGMHALVLGLLLTTLKFTLGYNIGSALNPASDFGPRVVAWAVGYRGPETFGTGWWFYGPWLATLVGSIIGCVLYDGFIFVGSESPINYKFKGGFKIKKRTRKLFDFVSRK